MMLGLESMSNRMMRLGSGELFFREYLSMDQILKQVDAVTVDDVHAMAHKLFDLENFTTIIFKPKGQGPALVPKVA